ncbi:hypothetical protein INT46_006880 [Mucor plumbeus]|uniref:Uncharacterized protein n=1 Tax=Mucor plumbeus TaxID=97098 RepID=A0A8H7ULG0_9FUNG|nr:hypothetical protein INT46_006880 [Mucor plumbeus]
MSSMEKQLQMMQQQIVTLQEYSADDTATLPLHMQWVHALTTTGLPRISLLNS